MKLQFDHNLNSSFYLWFENYLCEKNKATITGVNSYFQYADGIETPSNMNAFYSTSSQFFQGDALSSSSFMKDGNIYNQNTAGANKIFIDTNKSRILIDKSISQKTDIYSGVFVQKEFNLYLTNETEEQIILREDFVVPSGMTYLEYINKIAESKYLLPSIFINNDYSKNEGFAFGGLKNTTHYLKAIVFALSQFQLEGVLSCFRDSKEKCITIIDQEDFPYGEYWHCKSGVFDYKNIISKYKNNNVFIENVESYKLKDAAGGFSQKISKSIYMGYIDFEISSIRSF